MVIGKRLNGRDMSLDLKTITYVQPYRIIHCCTRARSVGNAAVRTCPVTVSVTVHVSQTLSKVETRQTADIKMTT